MRATRAQHRKAFGQHFLKDEKVISQIIARVTEDVATLKPNRVLEIGPGQGALTMPFLDRHITPEFEFFLSEKDRKIAAQWKEKSTITTLESDFLDLPEEAWLTQNLYVFSNLPYSAGTAIFTRLASHPRSIPAMVLMFQKEVADRILASPDEPHDRSDLGSLSLWTQNLWQVEKICDVSPKAFRPPPKVWSSVIRLTPRAQARMPGTEPGTPGAEKWESMIKAAFSQRRKMLRASLKNHPHVGKALERADVDGTKRSEALSWDEWTRWWNAFSGE